MHFPHPLADTWQCTTCSTELTEAALCPECHAVLCDKCETGSHAVPAGAKAGARCQPTEGVFEHVAAELARQELTLSPVPSE